MPFRYHRRRGCLRCRHRRRRFGRGIADDPHRTVAAGPGRTSVVARGGNEAVARPGSGDADDPAGTASRTSAAVHGDRARRATAPRARTATAASPQALTANPASQASANKQPGAARLGAVDRRDAASPAAPRAEAFDLDRELERVARLHEATKAHFFDPAEQRQLVRVTAVGQHRDRARLRERLELEHAREHRVAGKVAGEERLGAGHPVAGPDPDRRFAFVDVVDEEERGPVRQQPDERAPLAIRRRPAAWRRDYRPISRLPAGRGGYRPVRNDSFIHHVWTGHKLV